MRNILPASAALLALAGCTSSDLDRDGVTTFAGDSIAYNSALQMVDPWQYGVQQSKLSVPAERAASVSAEASSDGGSTAIGAKP
jgi:hypothetical protein